MTSEERERRGAQRREATRARLVEAAQHVLATGRTNVPIQDITAAAGLGTGSFYNHFETKEALYAAAIEDALEKESALLEAVTADIPDPAAVFATSFRIIGRLHRRFPQLSHVILNNAAQVMGSETGMMARARRDVATAMDAGRFDVDDLDVAMILVSGTALSLAQRLHAKPELDDAAVTDAVTEKLLRMLGLTARQARRVAHAELATSWLETGAVDVLDPSSQTA